MTEAFIFLPAMPTKKTTWARSALILMASNGMNLSDCMTLPPRHDRRRENRIRHRSEMRYFLIDIEQLATIRRRQRRE